MKKCQSNIRCWDSNRQHSEHESPPITTRPRLPPTLHKLFASHFIIGAFPASFFSFNGLTGTNNYMFCIILSQWLESSNGPLMFIIFVPSGEYVRSRSKSCQWTELIQAWVLHSKCCQMLDFKVAQFNLKATKMLPQQLLLKSYLGYFYKKICYQEHLEIAQSCHAEYLGSSPIHPYIM